MENAVSVILGNGEIAKRSFGLSVLLATQRRPKKENTVVNTKAGQVTRNAWVKRRAGNA